MKEIKKIIELYNRIHLQQRKMAMATVVHVVGSAYRRPGARMLITDDGKWEGSVSGGCLEGDALRKARKVMSDGIPMLITYNTMEESQNSLGIALGCNGIIHIFIEPVFSEIKDNPVILLQQRITKKTPFIMATVIDKNNVGSLEVGNRFFLDSNTQETIPEILKKEMILALSLGKSTTKSISVDDQVLDVFFEIIHPGINLIIFGAGYDTLPLVRMAGEMGWSVTITEDCIAHLSPNRFPSAEAIIYSERTKIKDNLQITDLTAAVLMSHNFKYDIEVMKSILGMNLLYLGIMGPRKRFDKIIKELEEGGRVISEEKYNSIHAPIGLDIGAETPEEIALAIIAEIQAVFRKKHGGFLKDRNTPIHAREEIIFSPRLKNEI